MSHQAIVVSSAAYALDAGSGRDYYWCSCGCSNAQPLYEGGYQGAVFAPEKFSAEQGKTVDFYGREQSADSILRDGAHQQP